jgi:hypothetical protein
LNGELISRSKCKPAALPAHTQSCIHYQTKNHPADYISTEYQRENSGNLLSESQLSIEQIGLNDLSWETLTQSEETYQEIVFLSQPVATISTGKTIESTLEKFSIPTPSQAAARELSEPVLLSLEEERLFLDYQALPTNEIRQGELNTPTIGEST